MAWRPAGDAQPRYLGEHPRVQDVLHPNAARRAPPIVTSRTSIPGVPASPGRRFRLTRSLHNPQSLPRAPQSPSPLTHLFCCVRSAPAWGAACPARPPAARRGRGGGARGRAARPPPRPPPAAPRRTAAPPPWPGRRWRRWQRGARRRPPPPTASRAAGGPEPPWGCGSAERGGRPVTSRRYPPGAARGSGGPAAAESVAAAIEERGAGAGRGGSGTPPGWAGPPPTPHPATLPGGCGDPPSREGVMPRNRPGEPGAALRCPWERASPRVVDHLRPLAVSP